MEMSASISEAGLGSTIFDLAAHSKDMMPKLALACENKCLVQLTDGPRTMSHEDYKSAVLNRIGRTEP